MLLAVSIGRSQPALLSLSNRCSIRRLHRANFCRIAEMPVMIRTVRPATTAEIDFCRWNEETLAREGLRWHE
jgi:hypothetical protein